MSQSLDLSTTGFNFQSRQTGFLRAGAAVHGPHIVQAYNNAKAMPVLREEITTWTMFEEKAKSELNARESEMLFWVARGKTNAGVAAILNLSPGTVRIHLEHIYAKLGVGNRTEASLLAVKKFGLTGGGR